MSLDFANLACQLERVHSPRIALRTVSLSDAWPLFHATQHPLFNRYLLWPRPDDDLMVRQRIELIADAAGKGRLAAVSAVVKDTGEWISLFRFQPFAGADDAMEMGIWTHHRFWHGRYSLELGRLCIDAAFTSCQNLQRLVGAASPRNKASCALMEQCGLVAGQLVDRPTEGGGTLPLREYDVTRAQWLGAHAFRTSFRRFEDQDHDIFPARPASADAEASMRTQTEVFVPLAVEPQFA